MTYYKVKPIYDNKVLSRIKNSNGKRIYYGILIGSELFTRREINIMYKKGVELQDDYFEKIEINKTDTYIMFGARFQKAHT